MDGVAGIYSLSENKLLHSIKGGGGAITSAVWAGSKAVIATATGRVKIVESQKEVGSFAVQAGSISALAVHPSGEILASVGHDRTYILYDLQSMNVLTQVSSDSGKLRLETTRLFLLTFDRTNMRTIPSGRSSFSSGCDGWADQDI